MLLDLLDYQATTGHLGVYYDAGNLLSLKLTTGDTWLATGVQQHLSRIFGNGEVGAYATLTDVPFERFGEGSFDKGIYVTIPIDWITGQPNQSRRKLDIRPITRDGGARLASARRLYREIRWSQNAWFIREKGRLWK